LRWETQGPDAMSRFATFLQDLRNATLLVRLGETGFRFGHTSVREFFLAEALHRRIREGRLTTLGGRPQEGWETIDFLLARQRHGVAVKEAAAFRANLPNLLREGSPIDLRFFATSVVVRAGGELAWPECADFSGFTWTGPKFDGSDNPAKGTLRLPTRAI
jgi:hypothetical protein